MYRGVFGSHVANVLRRLRRVCRIHGSDPLFLLASATIANPGELATRLTGLDDVTVIDRDGSPGTKRTIAMWNPPITDPATAARRSALAEAADLLAGLVIEGARTIVFMKSRKAVELMAQFATARAARGAGIRGWRSGSRPTARATRRSSGASSSGGWSTASCSASCRRTRWSSGSTSARWTRRSA